MAREKLGKTVNVWLQVRIPVELYNEFDAACRRMPTTKSVKTRELITRWLRQVAAVKRARAK